MRSDFSSRPSEHSRNREKFKTFRWEHWLDEQKFLIIRLDSPMVVEWGQQYNIVDKPTVIQYAYINRYAGTPRNMSLDIGTE